MILFLDFDGVLCTSRVAIAHGENGLIAGLDPVALRFLDRMCSRHDIKTVISSSWRYGQARRVFYQIFAAAGAIALAKSLHENWDTPTLADGIRGDEVQLWLEQNHPRADYIILDDSSDFHEYQKKFMVLTDCMEGMLSKHFIQFEELARGFE